MTLLPVPPPQLRRANVVYAALFRPPTFLGVRKEYAIGLGLFCYLLFALFGTFVLALLIFCAGALVLRLLSAHDVDAIDIFKATILLPSIYDPAHFSRSHVEVLR